MIKKKYLVIVATLLAVVFVFNVSTVINYNRTSKELKSAKSQITTIQNELNNTQDKLKSTIRKNNDLSNSLAVMSSELDTANATLQDLKSDTYDLVYLGNFKLTHYCNEKYAHICGHGNGLTSTGAKTVVGRTIAVDPSVIPYGTKVYVEGYGWRVAEDCGGGVNQKHIDILVDTHKQALAMGTQNGGVWILVKKS